MEVVPPLGGMPTIGGTYVDIFGQYLGLDPAVISATLSGSISSSLGPLPQRTFTASPCVVVTPLLHVKCVSPSGAGGNFSWFVNLYR